MTLVITDRRGLVHRVFADGSGCPTIQAARIRKPVTPNQCLVYHLPPCGAGCWPTTDGYERAVQGRAA